MCPVLLYTYEQFNMCLWSPCTYEQFKICLWKTSYKTLRLVFIYTVMFRTAAADFKQGPPLYYCIKLGCGCFTGSKRLSMQLIAEWLVSPPGQRFNTRPGNDNDNDMYYIAPFKTKLQSAAQSKVKNNTNQGKKHGKTHSIKAKRVKRVN